MFIYYLRIFTSTLRTYIFICHRIKDGKSEEILLKKNSFQKDRQYLKIFFIF